MSPTRQAIIAFWVIIVILLLWQFHTYNTGMTKQETEHPAQQHFYFYNRPAAPAAAASAVHVDAADVEQTGFNVQMNTPYAGSFTCQVTLKNLGTLKATGVQVNVRPYRGVALGDVDNGRTLPGTLNDNDPVSQIGQWVGFPDLGPGESATETAVFLRRSDHSPGTNPQPEILFDTASKAPTTTPTPHPRIAPLL